MAFCPICGNEAKGTFCEEHTEISFDYKDVVVRICACKKCFHRNMWLPFESLKKLSEKIAKDSIKEKVKLNSLVTEEIEKKKFEIEAEYKGELFIIPGKVQIEQCPSCSKKAAGNYYVSTLQIRPKDPEMLEFVLNIISKDDREFVTRVDELKDGWNFLLSSNKVAILVGRKLSKSYKGELKMTRNLHTYDHQESKSLYRSTVFFRKEE